MKHVEHIPRIRNISKNMNTNVEVRKTPYVMLDHVKLYLK